MGKIAKVNGVEGLIGAGSRDTGVMCDLCNDNTIHIAPGRRTILARELAKENGWLHENGKDICPNCATDVNSQTTD